MTFRVALAAVALTSCANAHGASSTSSSRASSSSGMGGHGGAPITCRGKPSSWTTVGATDTGRYAPAVLPLDAQTLLFAGGWDASKLAQKTAFSLGEDGTTTPSGYLSRARNFAAVAPVAGGFLVTGGFNDSLGSVTNTDLFDAASGTFAATGSLNQGRELFSTTALPDGRVVAIGGLSAAGLVVRANAEIYDPATGKWSLSGALVEPRFGQAALLVPSAGKVLLGGGKTTGPNGDVFRASLEWFDPATGSFAHAGDLAQARDRPTAALLADGRVIFVAGANATSQTLVTTEIFDPSSGGVSPGPPLTTRRMAHAMTVLGDGSFVVAGGWSDATSPSESTDTAERFDPTTMTWEPLPSLVDRRHDLGLASLGCTVVAFGGLHAKTGAPSTTPTSIETIDLTGP